MQIGQASSGNVAVENITDGPGAPSALHALEVVRNNAAGDAQEYATKTQIASWLLYADALVPGANDAATDLAAINAAILAVGATASAPKIIRLSGSFKLGATPFDAAPNIIWVAWGAVFDQAGSNSTRAYFSGDNSAFYGGMLTRTSGTATYGFSSCRVWLGTRVSAWVGALFNNGLDATNPCLVDILGIGAGSGDVSIGTTGTILKMPACGAVVAGTGTKADIGSASSLTASTNAEASGLSRTFIASGAGSRLSGRVESASPFTHTVTASGEGSEVDVVSNNSDVTLTVSAATSARARVSGYSMGATASFSGANHLIEIVGNKLNLSSNTATNSTINVLETNANVARTWDIGTRNRWNVNSVLSSTGKRTLANGSFSKVDFILAGLGGVDDVTVAATVDYCDLTFRLSVAGSSITIADGAAGNEIDVYSDTAPTVGAAAALVNTIRWFDTSSTRPILRKKWENGILTEVTDTLLTLASGTVTSAALVSAGSRLIGISYVIQTVVAGTSADHLDFSWAAGLTATTAPADQATLAKNTKGQYSASEVATAGATFKIDLEDSGGSVVSDGTGAIRVRVMTETVLAMPDEA